LASQEGLCSIESVQYFFEPTEIKIMHPQLDLTSTAGREHPHLTSAVIDTCSIEHKFLNKIFLRVLHSNDSTTLWHKQNSPSDWWLLRWWNKACNLALEMASLLHCGLKPM